MLVLVIRIKFEITESHLQSFALELYSRASVLMHLTHETVCCVYVEWVQIKKG